MEIDHLVGLTVIVAIAAVVHPDPYHAIGLTEHATAAVELWHKHRLFVETLTAGLEVQAVGTHAVIAEPDESVAVDEHREDGQPVGLAYHLRLLAVGEGVDAALRGGREDIEAVRLEAGDGLIGQYALLLHAQVAAVEPVYALVGTQPDVALIALGHAGDGQSASGGELALQAATVQPHDIEPCPLDGDEHVAGAGDEDGGVGAEFLVARDALEGVDDLVDGAVHHEHATVVHPHPDVLRLVDGQVEDAVVQVLDMAAVAGLVVVEVVAVESRQPVPGGHPQESVVVLVDARDGIARQPVVCGEVRE